ncbi:MAG: hypothetical protein GYB55_03730 [Cytophagales bacterium]|uniref:hypothetical protein n=1 Tax=Cyclobacterium marinum TaxID=104 RepID=UPI0030D7D4B2|nr:hypothetical protein [Cytophagales bacterium]|tara:strand:+ start:130775 stop:131572 length:798 start_codon:yes stop_codon:yes gene_type:complete
MINPRKNLINAFAIALLFSAASCVTSDLEEDMTAVDKGISSDEISGIMGLMEEVDLMIMSMMQQDLSQQRLLPLLDEMTCPGTVITRDDKNGQISVNFGSGCISAGGLEKQGSLTVKYTDNFLSKGSLLEISFEDFSVNGRKLQGTKTLENLGYDAVERKLKFSSSMEDFKIINADTQVFTVNQNYFRELELSSETNGFRIYLKGSGSLAAENYSTTTFEIVQPLKYMQECIESGSFNPIEGSLQISSKADKSTILSFESSGCSS